MTTLFITLFCVAAGCAVLLLILSVFLNNTPGRVFGYTSILYSSAAFFFASAAWRRLRVSLLVIMSIILLYLLISLVRIALDKKKSDGEADV